MSVHNYQAVLDPFEGLPLICSRERYVRIKSYKCNNCKIFRHRFCGAHGVGFKQVDSGRLTFRESQQRNCFCLMFAFESWLDWIVSCIIH